uniref:Uncharacterized protein n=1 Tax=viral metagenome TaxID=1070528 RepID=A0A6C0FDB6_9ZZZZ|tara:strand:- start:1596 stop:2336 length:741 start_codon:yes stop_codon:yes gene_type:complete
MSNFFLDSVKKDTSLTSLNERNDLTRLAYSNKSADIPLKNNSRTDRFEPDTFINNKESFERNNSRINSLNDEIRELKNKLKLVYEKDSEIQSLKNEKSQLESRLKESERHQNENNRLRLDNDSLKRELDMLKITGLETDKLKSENEMLKRKLLELTKEDNKNKNTDEVKEIQDTEEIEEIEEIETDGYSKETVSVDVPKLKNILYNRLKSYHENHIEKLISQYGLNEKKEIEKETMEKILLEAIHV